MLARLGSLALLASTLLSVTEAIPAFVPAKPERRDFGLAAAQKHSGDAEVMARSQSVFDEMIAKKAQSVASKYPVDYINNVSDVSMWEKFQDTGKLPEPIRGKTGATSVGPENPELDRQNPDTYAPPNSDHGTIPQAKWPFALSHNRLQNGGWARQQNQDVLPVATEIAGVNMRLEEGAYRELHWHQQAEWAYILNGTFRIAIIDEEGRNEVSDVGPGDLWYFASGRPHSIQALSPGGGEFLLVFDSGSFSEDSTLLLTDFLAHIPRSTLVKNFPGLKNSDFDKVPASELYIFPGDVPASNDTQQVDSPQGTIEESVTYKFSEQKATQLPGGSVKIVDSTNFKASKTIAAAEVVIEPGAIRELHWHSGSAEWDYFIEGEARITIFAGQENARTFDFQAGDTGYIEENNGHYIEALGDKPVKYLEIFKTAKYNDFSLSNWVALTPPAVVKAHLGFSDTAIDKLNRFKTKDNQVIDSSSNNNKYNNQKRDLSPRMIAGKRSWA